MVHLFINRVHLFNIDPIWYGLRIGIPYRLVWQMPFGELCDLIAIEQIKTEGAKLKHIKTEEEEREEFFEILKLK